MPDPSKMKKYLSEMQPTPSDDPGGQPADLQQKKMKKKPEDDDLYEPSQATPMS